MAKSTKRARVGRATARLVEDFARRWGEETARASARGEDAREGLDPRRASRHGERGRRRCAASSCGRVGCVAAWNTSMCLGLPGGGPRGSGAESGQRGPASGPHPLGSGETQSPLGPLP
jgi:hypothetical protein